MALIAFVVSACDVTPRPNEVLHPNAENIPDRDELADVIGMSRSAGEEVSSALRRFAASLTDARRIRAVGTLNGPLYTVWGDISDVAVDSHQNVYVVDSHYNEVRIFAADGRFVGKFGGPGQGPNEFRNPVALAAGPADQVVVAARTGGVKFFNRAGSTFELQRSIPIAMVPPRDMCLINDRIFVRGWRTSPEGPEERLIHVFDANGKPLTSFGPGYQSETWLVREQLSEGRVACTRDPSMVIVAFEKLPYLRAYTPDGELRWTSLLSDFRPPRVVESTSASGAPSVRVDRSRASDMVLRVTGTSGGFIVVQTLRLGARDPSQGNEIPIVALNSYVLSAATGDGVYVGDALPLIMEMTTDRFYAIERNEAYPVLATYEVGAQADG